MWIRKINDDTMALGLEPEVLKRLGIIWNLIPQYKVKSKISIGSPLFTVEATSLLKSLQCPMSGKIECFNLEALNKPDKITSETELVYICAVSPATRS